MRLDSISLRNFRNYEETKLDFAPGVNLIVGKNAQGKTNLLESIAFLGSGKSFRALRQSELVRFGCDFGEIQGSLFTQERQQEIRWVLFGGSRPRQLYRNGAKKKTAAEVAGMLPTVLFCPEDLMMLKAGASQRRRFGDHALCGLRPNYDAALTEYNRILEQKSRILKNQFENPALLDILPEYNRRLVQVGALLISYRARFYAALGESAAAFHREFSGGCEDFTLEYKTVSTVKDPFASLETLQENLQTHLESHARAERESGQCLTGPHKDDFGVSLSGIDLKAYGSQGQTRTAAISLKLAQRELMAREWKDTPVLLLDDVLSELDQGRQEFVLHRITQGQVFITCCEPGKFTSLGKNIEIHHGNVV